MIRTHTFRHFALVAFVCIALGCGGGSGGGLTPAPITTASAQTMAGDGVAAAGFLVGMSDLVGGFADVFGGNQVIPCDSGNVSVVINDVAPQGTLSTGDSATFTFNACVVDSATDPVTLNGRLSFSANLVTGTEPGPYAVQLTASFSGLTIVSSEGTVSVNGGFTLDYSTDDGISSVTTVSGSYLSGFASGGGEAFSGTLSDFRLENSVDESTGAYSVDLTATVSGSTIGGSVTYETTQPFSGTDPEDPASGSLVVTGAGGATITLIALDSVNVQILVDLDGDGVTDATINTTWDVIDPDDAPA